MSLLGITCQQHNIELYEVHSKLDALYISVSRNMHIISFLNKSWSSDNRLTTSHYFVSNGNIYKHQKYVLSNYFWLSKHTKANFWKWIFISFFVCKWKVILTTTLMVGRFPDGRILQFDFYLCLETLTAWLLCLFNIASNFTFWKSFQWT